MSTDSFFEDMKRYIGFSADDAATLRSLAPLIEPHLRALADRFYEEIPRHPGAEGVFTGPEQVARLKVTLQHWARGLFSGVYDEAYAQERFRIGARHVQIALPQRYVIAAMHVVDQFIRDVFDREIADAVARADAHRSLSRILNIDLNLICETYFEGSLRELRRLNDDLAASNRLLEDANRVRSEFLATVSHELRTPLTAIIGFSKLLADGRVAEASERVEFARDIHTGALTLLDLVDEILDVARFETGRADLRLGPVDLGDVIAEAANAVTGQARLKGLALSVDTALVLPPVSGDRPRLRQVLINLLGNAVKFTDRGSIRVRAELHAPDRRVSVYVEDTGIGIAPEGIPLLFEKFRQLDASHTRRHGGVGLGLAISKALVEQMGGSIELRSEGAGKGTAAIVTLAVAESSVVNDPARREAVTLLVADDMATRQQITELLTTRGHQVRQAATADGARAIAKSERVDVMLLDVTGSPDNAALAAWLNLLIELRTAPQTRRIDFFVLTDAATDLPVRVEFDVLVAPAIIQKPIDTAELERTLERIAAPVRARPLRLLVVDDDPLVFKFITQVLPAEQYSLTHASGGDEALGILDRHPCDALLLDLRMPKGSGYDVIRELKVGSAPLLPVIVLTNYPEPTCTEERQLLDSPIVVELYPKTEVARDPQALLDRLESLRSGR